MSNKILIVDDDESVLEFLQAALEIADYDVTAVATATEALSRLKSSPSPGRFPVVLTDITMPGIDGIQLLRIMKKEYPDSFVIMLTAHVSTELAIKSLNEGAFAYLTKPINVDELKATLKNVYEKYELLEKNKQLSEELRQATATSKSTAPSTTTVQDMIPTVIASDLSGNIKKINKAMGNLLGHKEKELIGTPLQSIFGQEFQRKTWQELIKESRVKNFLISFLAKDGREIKLFFTGTVMKDTNGQVVGLLGTTRGQ